MNFSNSEAAGGARDAVTNQELSAFTPTAGAIGAGRRVAVLGGGVGGLTTAHELAERGFEVTVYEHKALGGKARSIPVPAVATGGRRELPGEHGFRFFPGFYQNIPDTMSRIPFPGNARGVRDNLVIVDREMGAWNGKSIYLPTSAISPRNFTPAVLGDFLITVALIGGAVPWTDAALFASKMVAFLTSGRKRRMGQWENIGYARFMASEKLSRTGRTLLVDLPTSSLVAAKPDKANARTMGLMMEAWVYATLGLGNYTAADQVLNAPTNQAWIDPWRDHLRGLGVRFNVGWTVTGLSYGGGRITAAAVTDPTGAVGAIEADWYVLAVPVDRASSLLNSQIVAADPRLGRLKNLLTDWMNGVMIYTTEPVPINNGHVAYIGQPWALTSISQAQFWKGDFAAQYGDGSVADCLSIDLSNWDVPGILYGKPARLCTAQEIISEVIAQIRAALPNGDSVLPDSIIHSWFFDPAITGVGTSAIANDEPLLINTASSWHSRPDATTAIPNLFLAADYVRSNINLATMEGANEAGRCAANGVLAASGSAATPVPVATLYELPELTSFWANDDLHYSLGLPNRFDVIRPSWP